MTRNAEEFTDDFLPVDLDQIVADIVAGKVKRAEPTMLRRMDGKFLLYENKMHWLSSEPEAGKTALALIATRDCINANRKVVYFDWEMNEADIVRQLIEIGATPYAIRNHLDYIRPRKKMPDEVLDFYGRGGEDYPPLFQGAALVIFDAATEAMAMDGLDPNSNPDVATWLQRAPRMALEAGAAALVLDHVTKDWEGRGRYAIGGQHKLAQTDVHYGLTNGKPFRPGDRGESYITVHKDRPASVRRDAVTGNRAGILVLDSTGERLDAYVAPPGEYKGPVKKMRAIFEFAQASVVPLSRTQLESVGGSGRRNTANREAVTRLIALGGLVPGPGQEDKVYPKYVAGAWSEDGAG